jgi:predicted GNAT family N-acyltransferase
LTFTYEFTNQIDLEALRRLFAQADWTVTRTPEALALMLANTRVCVGVWDDERLIGFARAVTDDLYRAFVEDVIVDEAYRGQGIGAEIMRRLLERLAHVEEITLNCHDHLTPFYARLGFERAGLNYMHIWKGQ